MSNGRLACLRTQKYKRKKSEAYPPKKKQLEQTKQKAVWLNLVHHYCLIYSEGLRNNDMNLSKIFTDLDLFKNVLFLHFPSAIKKFNKVNLCN